MEDALEIGGHGAIAPEVLASRRGDNKPQGPATPVSRWKEVRLAHEVSASEVLGTIGGPSQPVMRVYEATIEYHLVSLGEDVTLASPVEVYRYMKDVMDKFPMNETLWVVMLNRKNKAIARHLCTIGTLTSALVYPREVFRPAILTCAASIMVVHNHRSRRFVESWRKEKLAERGIGWPMARCFALALALCAPPIARVASSSNRVRGDHLAHLDRSIGEPADVLDETNEVKPTLIYQSRLFAKARPEPDLR